MDKPTPTNQHTEPPQTPATDQPPPQHAPEQAPASEHPPPALQDDATAHPGDQPAAGDPFEGMSKSQMKKMKKRMEKRARWQETKQETRKARRERKKERRLADPEHAPYHPRKRRLMGTIEPKGNVIIDCEFGDKMNASVCAASD